MDGAQVVSGSGKFLAEHSIDTASLAASAEGQRQNAATVIFVGVGGKLAGFVAMQTLSRPRRRRRFRL